MTREHVDIVIGKMANKPGAGIILLKRIRTLIRYAMALGWTDRDPTAGVKGYKSKEIHTWNEGEISLFERRWPEGTNWCQRCASPAAQHQSIVQTDHFKITVFAILRTINVRKLSK
jgi:hypothetical protein